MSPRDVAPAVARVVALGIFDGVHLGHQALLKKTLAEAQRRSAVSCALTFHPHPACLLAPERAPALIDPLESRLELLRDFGLAEQRKLPFDGALAEMHYETFIDEILVGQLQVVHVVVGDDFSFGKGRAGTPVRFAAAAHARRFDVTFVPAVTSSDGERISSTRIRHAVANGDVALALNLLGRPFMLRNSSTTSNAHFARTEGRLWPREGLYEGCIAERDCRVDVAADSARIVGLAPDDLAPLLGQPLALKKLIA